MTRQASDLVAWREALRPAKSRLISMKVPEPLLEAFKTKARLTGIPYQTQIKRLMNAWLESSGSRPA